MLSSGPLGALTTNLVKRGKSVISNALSLDEPQLNFNWDVILPNLETLGFTPKVESASLPLPSLSSETYYDEGKTRYLPDIESVGSLTLVLFVGADNKTLAYLNTWRKLLKDDNGSYGYASKYVKPIECNLKDRLQVTVSSITYSCFPSTSSNLELVSDSSGRVTVTQEFVVTDYKINVKGTAVDQVFGFLGITKSVKSLISKFK